MMNFSTKILISHYELLFLIFIEVKKHKLHTDKAFMVMIILRNWICNGISDLTLGKNELYSISVLSAIEGAELSCNTCENMFSVMFEFHYSVVHFLYVCHTI